MITTIYKCDKCGSEQETDEQFWTVGVTAYCSGRYSARGGEYDYVEGMHMQVCRLCLEGFGIYAQKKPHEPVSQPTTEDLIREIIQRCTN